MKCVEEKVEAFRSAYTYPFEAVLSTALMTWQRYYRFLEIIFGRYEMIRRRYKEIAPTLQSALGSGKEWGDAENRALLEQGILSEHAQLEIQTFYIFAKLLLDRIADTCGYYLSVQWGGWGSSHTKLDQRFGDLAEERGWRVQPTNLGDLIKACKIRVIEYRNGIIEHPDEPRVFHATQWKGEDLLLYPVVQDPREGDHEKHQRPSEPLNELLELLGSYVIGMVEFFETNRMKSVITQWGENPQAKFRELLSKLRGKEGESSM